MTKWSFTKGLHDLGAGCHAYLQPDGSWGWSNAGLVTDSGEALLVDTLMDLRLTGEMLTTMRQNVPAAARIGTLVNTHSNPDHTFGNQLVSGAQIIASTACAREMRDLPPPSAPGSIRRDWAKLGEAGAFFQEVMGSRFSIEGITLTFPTQTFDDKLVLEVGDKKVHLVEVGPAHTGGDVVVFVPQDRVVFTGDILFMKGHPVVWNGPVSNWIRACDLMLGWDIDIVVPGHGPITDKSGIRGLKQYFEYVRDQSRKYYDAGIGYEEAARGIALDAFADWLDPERIVVNVLAWYREFSGDQSEINSLALRGAMARLYFERRRSGVR